MKLGGEKFQEEARVFGGRARAKRLWCQRGVLEEPERGGAKEGDLIVCRRRGQTSVSKSAKELTLEAPNLRRRTFEGQTARAVLPGAKGLGNGQKRLSQGGPVRKVLSRNSAELKNGTQKIQSGGGKRRLA